MSHPFTRRGIVHSMISAFRRARPRTRRMTAFLVCAASAAAAAAFLAIFVWALPVWLTIYPGVTGAARLTAMNNVRIGIAAILAVLGTIGGFAYTIQTYRLSRRGQIADRYTKAIEQLTNASSDIRIGGLYALKQTTRDATEYQDMVMEVLVAYIRSHAPWNPPRKPPSLSRSQSLRTNDPDRLLTGQPDQDIQVALDILGRLIRGGTGKTHLDLSNTNLSGANLTGICLVDCRLINANLTDAKLNYADLQRADLRGTELDGAQFYRTNLTDVTIWRNQVSLKDLDNVKGLDSIQQRDPENATELFSKPNS
jgi:hypothetical protein